MKDAWFLASNRTDLSAAKALQLYGQRWGIETSFRDIKDYKFGMGMGDVQGGSILRLFFVHQAYDVKNLGEK